MPIYFTETELDEAADKAASGALGELPDRIYDFLAESQIEGMRADLRDFIKTGLLFDLMNHLRPE